LCWLTPSAYSTPATTLLLTPHGLRNKIPDEVALVIGSGRIGSPGRPTDLQKVLEIYADLAGAPLDIEPRVRELNAQISFGSTQSLSRSDAIRLLGQAMQDQAGIVIQPTAKNRIEVTLDDQPKKNPIR